MSVDIIGDFLTIIRNGIMRAKPSVEIPHSRLKQAILETLKDEGFIRDFAVVADDKVKKILKVYLKYSHGESVIHELTRISTPGCRQFAQVKSRGRYNVRPVIGGLGVSILTTSRGILSHKMAKKLGVGGEIICTVW